MKVEIPESQATIHDHKLMCLFCLGDKLICTHIHDNRGKDLSRPDGGDLHLLPFDGDIDYQKMMKGLNGANYQGSLMLEVGNRDYGEMSADEFLADCYQRIKKISLL